MRSLNGHWQNWLWILHIFFVDTAHWWILLIVEKGKYAGRPTEKDNKTRRDGTWARTMKIVTYGPSHPGFEPAAFQLQAQSSMNWTTGVVLNIRKCKKEWKQEAFWECRHLHFCEIWPCGVTLTLSQGKNRLVTWDVAYCIVPWDQVWYLWVY